MAGRCVRASGNFVRRSRFPHGVWISSRVAYGRRVIGSERFVHVGPAQNGGFMRQHTVSGDWSVRRFVSFMAVGTALMMGACRPDPSRSTGSTNVKTGTAPANGEVDLAAED